MNNRILITGVAGFIGFSLAKNLLERKIKVYGIDNFDDYYSISLKKLRIKLLKKYKNFYFKNVDFTKKKLLEKYFKKNNFSYVVHLGAQAGVRYSLVNPDKYFLTNFIGFNNIIELSIKKKIKKFLYASSSSVYGEQKRFPVNENMELSPKNIYARTKKLNEEVAFDVNRISKISMIGMRFFTVYGEWGRPDMFILKFLKALYKNKKMKIFNKGNHLRDFTYINDVTEIIYKLINKKEDNKHHVFNICSNKPIHLKKLINMMDFLTKKKSRLIMTKFQKADVLKTHGDNKKIRKFINIKKFTNFDIGLKKTIDWYVKNKVWKY